MSSVNQSSSKKHQKAPVMLNPSQRSATAPTAPLPSISEAIAKATASQNATPCASSEDLRLKPSVSEGELTTLPTGRVQLDKMTFFHPDDSVDPKFVEDFQKLKKDGYEFEKAGKRAAEIALKETMQANQRPSLENVKTTTQEEFYAQNAENPFGAKVNSNPPSPSVPRRKFSLPINLIPSLIRRKTNENE